MLGLLTSTEILDRATTVDFVTDAAFIEASKNAKLPKPTELNSARRNTYTDLLARQLQLHYDEPVDGRIIAIRFIDHLVDMTDKDYHIERPELLNGLGFDLDQIQRLSRIKNPPPEIRQKLESLRQRNEHLNEYASGRLRIVGRDDELGYYFFDAVPQTHFVSITVPIGSNHGSQGPLYRSFLERLGK